MMSRQTTRRLEHKKWLAIGGFCSLLAALATAVGVINLNEILEQDSKVPGGGVPYATAVGIFGAAVTALIATAAYLAGTRWNTQRFCQVFRFTMWTGVAAAWACSLWFIFVTDLFNQFGVFGLLLASFGAALGIKASRLIEASTLPNPASVD